MFPLNRSPDFAVPMSPSPSHMRFCDAVTNARPFCTAYSCGAVADFHRLPVHSACVCLVVDTFLCWNPVPVGMFDLPHFRDAVRNRNHFLWSITARDHNMNMRRTVLEAANHILNRKITVTQNVIQLIENN